MRIQLAVLVVAAAFMGTGAMAQTTTPPDCHWVAVPESPSSIEMWCRGPDGRARPTGKTMLQGSSAVSDGCPSGQVYDGRRCVSEAAALAAAPLGYIGPERPATPQPKARTTPRVLLFQDRDGRNRQGMACVDQRDVTVCQPIPRH